MWDALGDIARTAGIDREGLFSRISRRRMEGEGLTVSIRVIVKYRRNRIAQL
jgi:predicted DNA-binding ribbon-helix-helix protein